MKFLNTLLSATVAIATFSMASAVKADTVNARCDIYPKGQDQAKSSGMCTFSQRQGFVDIELKSGKRYELRPVEDKPGNYLDQNGHAAYRQSGLGDKGQIYRLLDESIYVYWDATPSKGSSSSTASPSGNPIAARGVSTLKASGTNGRINVRSQPTIKSSSPHYGVSGDKVKVIQCVQDQDTAGSDLNWCKVQFVQSKATGWIRSDFIIFADGGE